MSEVPPAGAHVRASDSNTAGASCPCGEASTSERVPPVAARVEARLARAPVGFGWGLLRWLTGWALLSWVFETLGMLVGVRRTGSFSLEPAGVRVAQETRAGGRVVRRLDQVVRLEEVRFGRRHVRYPALRRLVGLLAFCVGSLVGAVIIYDGAAVMERRLVMLGAGLIGAGCLLDLFFDVVLSGGRGRVALELGIGRRRYCLRDVPLDQADRFMDALARSGPSS